jgi:hypothetical protein
MSLPSSSRRLSWRAAASLSTCVALAAAGCASPARRTTTPAPAPAPILADAAQTPGTAEQECGEVVVHLRRYSQCTLIDEDRRDWLGRWSDAVASDLALASRPGIDEASRQQIAVSCRKAAEVLHRTADRCAAEAEARPAQPGPP